ncbi:MAG: hypothetical protein V1845_03640 [bacterium]
MDIKTEEIISGSSKPKQISSKPRTVCEIFRFQPENMEQMPLGNLFIVAGLCLIRDCGHLNNLLASLIKREYYSYPQKGALKSLQSALKKANSHLDELAKQGNCEWMNKIHFICATIAGRNLQFAQAGDSKTYLFRQGHFIDLGRKAVPDTRDPDPSKIFSSVVSGNIEAEDILIMATPQIEEVFSANGLKQLVTSRPGLPDISDQINKVLREQEKTRHLAILLLQTQQEPEPPASQPDKNRKIITPPINLSEILN